MDNDEIDFPGMDARELAIRRRVRRLAEFYRHLVVYVIVNIFFWATNAASFVSSGKTPTSFYQWWAFWPTVGWGIGLLAHGLTVLPHSSFFSPEWEERKVRELLKRDAD